MHPHDDHPGIARVVIQILCLQRLNQSGENSFMELGCKVLPDNKTNFPHHDTEKTIRARLPYACCAGCINDENLFPDTVSLPIAEWVRLSVEKTCLSKYCRKSPLTINLPAAIPSQPTRLNQAVIDYGVSHNLYPGQR